MTDEALIEKLIITDKECNRGIWAWTCWCKNCTTNILNQYNSKDKFDLPASVRRRIENAIEGKDPNDVYKAKGFIPD